MNVSPTMEAVSRTVTTLMEASTVPVALGTAWTAMDSTAAVRYIFNWCILLLTVNRHQ